MVPWLDYKGGGGDSVEDELRGQFSCQKFRVFQQRLLVVSEVSFSRIYFCPA